MAQNKASLISQIAKEILKIFSSIHKKPIQNFFEYQGNQFIFPDSLVLPDKFKNVFSAKKYFYLLIKLVIFSEQFIEITDNFNIQIDSENFKNFCKDELAEITDIEVLNIHLKNLQLMGEALNSKEGQILLMSFVLWKRNWPYFQSKQIISTIMKNLFTEARKKS